MLAWWTGRCARAGRGRTLPSCTRASTSPHPGHAHQFVCDLSGALLHVSDPLPGKTHDAQAIDDTGLSDILRGDNCIGDKGFIGVRGVALSAVSVGWLLCKLGLSPQRPLHRATSEIPRRWRLGRPSSTRPSAPRPKRHERRSTSSTRPASAPRTTPALPNGHMSSPTAPGTTERQALGPDRGACFPEPCLE